MCAHMAAELKLRTSPHVLSCRTTYSQLQWDIFIYFPAAFMAQSKRCRRALVTTKLLILYLSHPAISRM